MTLARVELRRLLARRAVRVLATLFLTLIGVVVLANYLHANADQPLTWTFVRDGGLGFGGGFAIVAYVTGATAGGAEWAARTVEAVLVWEPRRVRLLLTKATVLAVTIALAAVLVQVLVGALTRLAVAGEGTMTGAGDDFWSDYVGNAASVVALAVLATVLGFAVASLTRNTGFAMGAAFVYLGILDHALSLLPDWIEPFTVNKNVAALLSHGFDIQHADGTVTTLTTGRAAVTLVLYVGLILFAATALFRRRDVT
jgi:ABC-type transport system involved in multi-copper enzyme maturation permease subunit